ncbi:superoxide dismutase family protein [Hydrogenophaga sp. UC242_50]|uniref:superoxide dismutase family protein n=1 Tax=Hydrogenophaga sp. UC242_50 TaxID=3350169 RepID=UPI0036D24AA9
MPRHLSSCVSLAAVLVLGAVAGCRTTPSPADPGGPTQSGPERQPAVAQLVTASGQSAGRAELVQTPAGVEIAITVQGLTPGLHGFHIHAHGACAPGPDPATGQTVAFGAAGCHFDPGQSHNHGQPGQPAHQAHAGELPNITVGADGTGSLRYLNPNVTLSRGPDSAFGRALVVHQNPDDHATDPAGNSGARVLCGVIQAARPSAATARTTFDGASVFPEGIAIDQRTGDAYVGSTNDGNIWRLPAGANKAELFQAGGAVGRQAAFGMKVDVAGRLWVAGGPQGNVAVIDLNTGMTVAQPQEPEGLAHLPQRPGARARQPCLCDRLVPPRAVPRPAGDGRAAPARPLAGPLHHAHPLPAQPDQPQRHRRLARWPLADGGAADHGTALAHRHRLQGGHAGGGGRRRPALRRRPGAAGGE